MHDPIVIIVIDIVILSVHGAGFSGRHSRGAIQIGLDSNTLFLPSEKIKEPVRVLRIYNNALFMQQDQRKEKIKDTYTTTYIYRTYTTSTYKGYSIGEER